MYYTSGCVLVITEYMHIISTDRPQYDTIGHQESSLSLKHGLRFSLFKLSTHSTTKDKASAMCLLANRIFVLSSQKHVYRYKATNSQYSSKRRHCLVTRRLLSRGAVCANAHAYARAFLVRPGALGWLQLRNISGKIHFMK